MKNIISTLVGASVLAVGSIGFSSLNAQAEPALQLGVTGGTYVGGTQESGLNTSNPFTLNAYCKAGTGGSTANCTSGSFFVSIAILDKNLNKVTSVPSNIGTFSFGGVTYDPTTFTYGQPSALTQSHGVFDTLFTEVNIGNFSGSPTTKQVDTQTSPSYDPTLVANAGTADYYKSFLVNISGLNEDYRLHFDLYGNGKNAPFSHDVISTVGEKPNNSGPVVPEPLTMLGAGAAVAFGGAFKRKLAQAKKNDKNA